MYTYSHVITSTDKQTHGSTSMDARRSTFTNSHESACTDVSTEITGVHGSIFPYISTKYTDMYGVMSTEVSIEKTAVQGITNAYDNYGRYETKRDIDTDVLGKVQKGIRYTGALQKGS